uniref:tRNA-cytidine(32) 2-sulfurtransferase n=1 Tax=uncultured Thiotrichaceae bacterium TaxID=298394 RepID=A0A6S6RZ12_9GAMM|nr:MAG: tRNA(Cytosine32)-2-thiocytidine synthetase [uncultured Thiotrichaceae bacterium]
MNKQCQSKDKSGYSYNKLRKRLRRQVGEAIVDFSMIEEGDRIMVCLSGGKDSYTMLDILLELQKAAPVSFELFAVNLDQKQPGYPEEILPAYLESLGVQHHIIERDTYSVVKRVIPEGKTTCGLCSRLRRGTLYGYAEEHGFTKIALGHHRDDIIETLFLNLFYGGKLKAMPPKLRSDDKRNILIRPLAYCKEKDIQRYADAREFPIIPCNLCGSQANLQRQAIKQMLTDWDKQFPGRIENIFAGIQNIAPSQLADQELFDFKSLELDRSQPNERTQRDNREWLEEAIDPGFDLPEVMAQNQAVSAPVVQTIDPAALIQATRP